LKSFFIGPVPPTLHAFRPLRVEEGGDIARRIVAILEFD
jgi:hypothetical protein